MRLSIARAALCGPLLPRPRTQSSISRRLGQAFAHHPSIQILSAKTADSERSGVAVCSRRHAFDRAAIDVLDKTVTGDDAAIPFGTVSIETHLIEFRRIDPFEANFSIPDRQGFAVYNPGNAGDLVGGMRMADEEECDQTVQDKHRLNIAKRAA